MIKKLEAGHRSQIRYLVGNLHVATPDGEVAEMWRKKCLKAGTTPGVATQCSRIAVKEHQKNRRMFMRVARG